jgi:predicted transcriptional regulator YdeE
MARLRWSWPRKQQLVVFALMISFDVIHRDHISAIGTTWKAIWNQALPDSGYKAADGPAFECYPEQFDGRTGLGGLEIWIPVKA